MPESIGDSLILVDGGRTGPIQPGKAYYDLREKLLAGVAAAQDSQRGFVPLTAAELERAFKDGHIRAVDTGKKGPDGQPLYKFEIINFTKDDKTTVHCPLFLGDSGAALQMEFGKKLYTLPVAGANGNFRLVDESGLAAERDRGNVQVVEYAGRYVLAVKYAGDMASAVEIGGEKYAVIGVPLYSMYLDYNLKAGAAELGSDGNVYFNHGGKAYKLS